MSNNNPIPRYQATYRRDELRLICDYAREGRSLAFVGVAGVGKSNITNFLRFDPYGYKPHHLGEATTTILFPFIDGNVWNRTPLGLWEQLLADLEQASADLPSPPSDAKIIQLSEEQRVFSTLRNRIQWLTASQGRQIMFILDDFDNLLRLGPLTMLEQLYTLRLAGNQNKLSYLLFVKRLPAALGRALLLSDHAKFYDLFKRDIYPLQPYEHEDTAQMLRFLNENAGHPMRAKDLALIGDKLSGGHPGLAKVIFNLWRRQPPGEEDDLVYYFSQQPDVLEECRRIVEQLHPEEQATASQLARGQASDPDYAQLLLWRGLLCDAETPTWFSPLMQAYLRQ